MLGDTEDKEKEYMVFSLEMFIAKWEKNHTDKWKIPLWSTRCHHKSLVQKLWEDSGDNHL